MVGEFIDSIDCLLFGKCKIKEYEYYFYLNNEKVKADKCFSNFYGYSSCTYNGIDYNNVAYESIFVKEYTKENDIKLIYIILPIFGLYISFLIFKTIFSR